MKWIIITGESGKLGYEISKAILEDNEYGIIGLSRSTSDYVIDLELEYKDRYVHLEFDLENINEIKNLYLEKIKRIGAIYGLVNNAAFAYDDIVTNVNIKTLEKMYTINILSPIMLTKYAIRDMLLNNTKGSIIHISSVSAHTGYKGLSMYASTKGALEAFSLGTAREWGSVGIRSNCIAPGFMETAMSDSLDIKQKDRIYNRTSMKKATNPASVAQSVKFLLSTKASSITGEVLHVDNGTI